MRNGRLAWYISVLFCAMAASSAGFAEDIRVNPRQMTGLRSFSGTTSGAFLLSFNAVKRGTEDRTVAHFGLAGLRNIQSATLNIDVDDIDPGAPYGQFDVYSFAGDGVVSVDEWNAGTLFHSFKNVNGGHLLLSVDATSILQNAVTRGDNFLSFSFRDGNGNDRYWLRAPNDPCDIADPDAAYMMVTVPEPLTLALLALGATILPRRRNR
jgi:hypothetical protein